MLTTSLSHLFVRDDWLKNLPQKYDGCREIIKKKFVAKHVVKILKAQQGENNIMYVSHHHLASDTRHVMYVDVHVTTTRNTTRYAEITTCQSDE